MDARVSRDQFLAGLADGIRVLALAAAVWFAMAASAISWLALALAAVPILLLAAVLVSGSHKLRQRSSFSRSQARTAPKGSATRRIRTAFSIVGATQTAAVIAAGSVCFAVHRLDVLWPAIGVIVSLHFLPLGWIFNVRAYYVVGLFGAVWSFTAIVFLRGSATLIAVGLGLGVILTVCAAYMLARSESLARESAVTPDGLDVSVDEGH